MKLKRYLFLLIALLAMGFTACKDDDPTPDPDGGEIVDPVQPPKPSYTQRVNSNLTFYSKILNQEIKYTVILPKEYLGADVNDYGVVYLFHGWGCDQNSWGQGGVNIQSVYDAAHTAGRVQPLIFVIPQGFNSYFVNRFDGGFRYMDMLIGELVPLIDKTFRTKAQASSRAVAGFSMGGFGALSTASQHPEIFSVCIGLSPSLNTDEEYKTLSSGGWDPQWGAVFGGKGTSGNSRITPYYRSQCPLHFFAEKPASLYAGVRYLIDCGDDEERLYAGNGELHLIMGERGIAHEYRVRNGAHTESYWREGMREGLDFIEAAFTGMQYKRESLLDMTVTGNVARRNISVGGESVHLTLPVGYDQSKTYNVLYVSQGASSAGLTSEDIDAPLDSLMQKRRFVIAHFDPAALKGAGVKFADLAAAVETEINTPGNTASRVGLAYGKDADYLYEQVCGSSPMLQALFAEDSAPASFKDSKPMKMIYLDITDEGTMRRESHEWFCYLRSMKSQVDYRVRNGYDSRESARTGIRSMVTKMAQFFPSM